MTELKHRIVLHTSVLAHTARAYPGFRSMKRLGVLLLPLDGMLVHRRLPPSISSGFPDSCWYPFILLEGERRCESKVSCPRTQQNDRPGLKPGPFHPESSVLTIRPPRLP